MEAQRRSRFGGKIKVEKSFVNLCAFVPSWQFFVLEFQELTQSNI
jgi:hypothetical protein